MKICDLAAKHKHIYLGDRLKRQVIYYILQWSNKEYITYYNDQIKNIYSHKVNTIIYTDMNNTNFARDIWLGHLQSVFFI
jgi:hypothetical protein